MQIVEPVAAPGVQARAEAGVHREQELPLVAPPQELDQHRHLPGVGQGRRVADVVVLDVGAPPQDRLVVVQVEQMVAVADDYPPRVDSLLFEEVQLIEPDR